MFSATDQFSQATSSDTIVSLYHVRVLYVWKQVQRHLHNRLYRNWWKHTAFLHVDCFTEQFTDLSLPEPKKELPFPFFVHFLIKVLLYSIIYLNYLFKKNIYLAVLGLSCNMWDLQSLLQHIL